MRILLVEDDANAGDGLRALLEMDDYEVDLVRTFADASRRVASCLYDVALIDIKLPDGDGKELVGMLKENNTRVWLATGSVQLSTAAGPPAFEDPRHLAKLCGADGYVSKPIDYDRLVELFASTAE